MVQPPQKKKKKKKTRKISGKVDTSYLITVMIWVTNITYFEWVSWTHIIPYIAKKIKKVIEKTNYIVDILPTKYTQQTLEVLHFTLIKFVLYG